VKSYPPMPVSSGVLAPAGGAPPELVISYVLNSMTFLPRCRFKPARALRPAGTRRPIRSTVARSCVPGVVKTLSRTSAATSPAARQQSSAARSELAAWVGHGLFDHLVRSHPLACGS
jgi:hypothetical protein